MARRGFTGDSLAGMRQQGPQRGRPLLPKAVVLKGQETSREAEPLPVDPGPTKGKAALPWGGFSRPEHQPSIWTSGMGYGHGMR